jgi:hypothetical protein
MPSEFHTTEGPNPYEYIETTPNIQKKRLELLLHLEQARMSPLVWGRNPNTGEYKKQWGRFSQRDTLGQHTFTEADRVYRHGLGQYSKPY